MYLFHWQLHHKVRDLEEEKEKLTEMASQAEYFASVLKVCTIFQLITHFASLCNYLQFKVPNFATYRKCFYRPQTNFGAR